MSVNLIFKIAAVGILVTVLSQVLKPSGRGGEALFPHPAGPGAGVVLGFPYIFDLFDTMQRLFAL